MAASSARAVAPIPADGNAQQAWLDCLPSYSRSLLRIRVPVSVTLATTKLPVHKIVELVPGSILQFEKMCDETLSLEVGGHQVAEGETVKVGDKFGLRITSIVMPQERFVAVVGKQAKDEQARAADDEASNPQQAHAPAATAAP